MAVKTFFNGDLEEEEIYMDQLEDFVVSRKEDKVCKLQMSLYDLKQAPNNGMKSLIRLNFKSLFST